MTLTTSPGARNTVYDTLMTLSTDFADQVSDTMHFVKFTNNTVVMVAEQTWELSRERLKFLLPCTTFCCLFTFSLTNVRTLFFQSEAIPSFDERERMADRWENTDLRNDESSQYESEWMTWNIKIKSISDHHKSTKNMPKIRTSRTKAPPDGFDEIEPTLLEFAQRLKDGTSASLSLTGTTLTQCS